MNKLFLLDAYALIYRAYYAFMKNPRINSKGHNTSAILGFVNTLEEVLQKEQPTHIGVAFDPHGGTFRHDAYPEYKAQREETPEAIRYAVPMIKELLAAYRIPVLEVEGYEADDVIGTLAHQADRQGITTYMMTPDKDYGQLVTEHVAMYRPAHGAGEAEKWGPKEVCEKWGIDSPLQVVDLLGLMGDASDNFPGCPGVGEKTAVKLIKEYGSVENLLLQTDKLKGAMKTKVATHVEEIKMSKWLATIRLDVPITLDMDALQVEERDTERVQQLFEELEFRHLMKKKSSAVAKSDTKKTKKVNTDGSVQSDLFSLFDGVDGATPAVPQTAPSTETPKNEPLKRVGDTLVLHITAEHSDLSAYKAVLEDEQVEKVGHDLKYQMHLLEKQGISLRGKLFDTMLAHYLLHPEMRHGLDYIKASCRTTDLLEIKHLQEEKLEQNGMTKLFQDIEMPLMPVLAQIESTGVRLDTASLAESSRLFTEKMNGIEREIHQLAGMEFNVASPKQVGEVLFDHLKLSTKAKKTKGGQYATSEEILEALRPKHEVVGKILEHRGLKKLLGTYIDALPLLIRKETGHIHTSFNQAVTTTGRLSSSEPNLQNIPVRDAQGKEVRKAFIPDEGEEFLSADYSQIELRLMAHLSQDPHLIEAFRQGHDIHAATAAKIFKKEIGEVTREERSRAKTANFGIIYGISAFGLAERMGVSRTEAKQLIDGYFDTYPAVRRYMDESIEKARQRGYTETLFGRRCYLPDINSANAVVRGYAERNAINAPIQGTAADIIKIAMVRVARRMKEEGMRAKMILQVHDELNFSVPTNEKERMQNLVKEEMEQAAQLAVPLIVDFGWGKNWLEAH
ncbi:MAG: DNA polymerase I [Bacteroidales bacterium]|nr:DNA polymerase I [Candidatus Physcousia equi]